MILDPATQIALATIWGKTLTILGFCGLGGVYLWKSDNWIWSIAPLATILIALLWGVDISKIF